MENLYLPPTEMTPEVHFEFTAGILEIIGKSYSSEPLLFYRPVLDWLDLYIHTLNSQYTILNIKLTQFNDDTTKILLQIFQKVNKMPKSEINWYYDDKHILELGEDLSFMVGSKFNFVKMN